MTVSTANRKPEASSKDPKPAPTFTAISAEERAALLNAYRLLHEIANRVRADEDTSVSE